MATFDYGTSATLVPVPKTGRVARRPAHHFNLVTRPYQLQPFMIAPVLPGETMKSLLLNCRVMSDPIKNSLIGWWKEYYFFYVKLRDLEGRDDFTQMILTPSHSLASYNRAAAAWTYHAGPSIDWTYECLKWVTSEWFRDEGEAWNVATLDSAPMVSINTSSWIDSLKLGSVSPTATEELPGENMVLPDHMAAFTTHFDQWQHMRALKLTAATFEDWLKTFGVTLPREIGEESHRPELIRYVRDWTYPVDTLDSIGAPAAGLRWNIQERADKDRFFKEPGFLFGVTVARPKIYLSGQKGAAVITMDDAFSWLPAVLSDEVYTSLRTHVSGGSPDGPLGNVPSGAYWFDLRDLLLYGDQFLNYALTATDKNLVALPTSAVAKRFAASADIDAMFSAASPLNTLKEDGVVNLNILGRQVDHT